jgi:hypothetical protein
VVDQAWADTEDRFERAWHNLSGAARIVRDRLGGQPATRRRVLVPQQGRAPRMPGTSRGMGCFPLDQNGPVTGSSERTVKAETCARTGWWCWQTNSNPSRQGQ